MTGRWGLTVPLEGLSLPEHRELVTQLPDLGYTDLWSAEANGADAFTPLVLASQWAPELRLGTAIAPVYTRGPGLLAMSAASAADCAPGRFVLGVGTSSQVIVENWNAAEFTEPYARTRDTVRFLRTALAGEKVTAEYPTFTVRGFRLGRPPETPPPVMVAALRPGMLRMAGRESDGAITNWLAASDVPAVRGELGADAELVARIFVCPVDDADEARALARRHICAYLTVPVYRAFHDWLGRGERLAPMQEAWAAGDRKRAVELVPDDVVDELVVHGSPDACRDGVRAYAEAGVTTPVLMPLTTGGDPAGLVRALAPE
ncbi:putative F420-dependent oxidoreductase [Prauserella sediminis]|uniref:Putative F420-dependent oxidoreductase n=1 Tax=Prauserella sediminis TaxID=577680 RepID=A0A839XWP7_9PSEU|nr:LLM class F420-dependent oxidoreductase [Prauserella sediminis]MBB3664903.1 putative F420-dependent oxidoreductase [Prauserella sediminis]